MGLDNRYFCGGVATNCIANYNQRTVQNCEEIGKGLIWKEMDVGQRKVIASGD